MAQKPTIPMDENEILQYPFRYPRHLDARIALYMGIMIKNGKKPVFNKALISLIDKGLNSEGL